MQSYYGHYNIIVELYYNWQDNTKILQLTRQYENEEFSRAHVSPAYSLSAQSYIWKCDKKIKTNKKCVTNTNAHGINLGATDLDLVCDTLSHGGKHFYQIILKTTKEWQSDTADTIIDPFFTFDI